MAQLLFLPVSAEHPSTYPHLLLTATLFIKLRKELLNDQEGTEPTSSEQQPIGEQGGVSSLTMIYGFVVAC